MIFVNLFDDYLCNSFFDFISTFAINIFLKVLYSIRASYVLFLFLLIRWIESNLLVQSDFENNVLDLRDWFEILFIE